jgi:hypothetical protein
VRINIVSNVTSQEAICEGENNTARMFEIFSRQNPDIFCIVNTVVLRVHLLRKVNSILVPEMNNI